MRRKHRPSWVEEQCEGRERSSVKEAWASKTAFSGEVKSVMPVCSNTYLIRGGTNELNFGHLTDRIRLGRAPMEVTNQFFNGLGANDESMPQGCDER